MFFTLATYLGYVQDVTAVQQSQQTSNLYYDVTFQVPNVENKTKHYASKRGWKQKAAVS